MQRPVPRGGGGGAARPMSIKKEGGFQGKSFRHISGGRAAEMRLASAPQKRSEMRRQRSRGEGMEGEEGEGLAIKKLTNQIKPEPGLYTQRGGKE